MSDTDEVQTLHASLLDAWNNCDARQMAALYADKGGQVGFDGSVANTPAEIQEHLEPIFRDHPTARFVAKIREVRMIGADAAILRAVAGMVPPGKSEINPKTNAIQTLVASKSSGRWRIEMFHNTPAAFHDRPDEAEKLTKELQALL